MGCWLTNWDLEDDEYADVPDELKDANIWDLINDSEVFNILSHEHNRNNHNSVDVGPDSI